MPPNCGAEVSKLHLMAQKEDLQLDHRAGVGCWESSATDCALKKTGAKSSGPGLIDSTDHLRRACDQPSVKQVGSLQLPHGDAGDNMGNSSSTHKISAQDKYASIFSH
jgi:hypothetical protein